MCGAGVKAVESVYVIHGCRRIYYIKKEEKRMKTLYLHIGTPKTATTSLQMFCVDNQKLLNEKGYTYPILDFQYPHVALRRNGHFLVGKLYKDKDEEDVEKEIALWNRGLDLIHTEFERYDHVILSDENIWHASVGQSFSFWERLKEDAKQQGYEIKIIVYLRRQDGMANSWLSQQIKEGWNKSAFVKWNNYKKKPDKIKLDYYSLLEKIAGVMGKENIILRVFERDKFKGNGNTIFSDFLEAMGLEYTDEYQIKNEEANQSLTGNSQEIMRIMNSLLPDNGSMRELLRRAAARCEELKDVDNHFSMFSKEEAERFMAKYQESNDRIAREYLGQDEPLFGSQIKDDEVWTPNNRFMYEDIIRFLGNIIIEQHQRILDLRDDVKNLKDSRIQAVRTYMEEFEAENPDAGKEEKYITLSESLINQHQDVEKAVRMGEKMEEADNRMHALSVNDQILKDEITELRNEIARIRAELKAVERDSMLFRVRRKINTIRNNKNA